MRGARGGVDGRPFPLCPARPGALGGGRGGVLARGGGAPSGRPRPPGTGEVFFWPTPWGLRVYDPRRRAFLTRKDDPKTLAEGLRGRLGLRLTGREAGVLGPSVGVEPRPSALGRALGLAPWQARFALQGLGRKFGLSLEALLRLARHQVQVAGLQDHLDPPPGREVEPGLHVPGRRRVRARGPWKRPR